MTKLARRSKVGMVRSNDQILRSTVREEAKSEQMEQILSLCQVRDSDLSCTKLSELE